MRTFDPMRVDGPEGAFHLWLQAREAGEAVKLEDLCARCPAEWRSPIEELAQAWQGLEEVHRRLGIAPDLAASDSNASPRAAETRGPSGTWRNPATPEVLRRLLLLSPRQPRYRALDALGAGGMGEVFRVRDVALHRELAMKVLKRKVGAEREDHERQLHRLLEEAQITAQLQHPGVVPVHDIGLDDRGRVFFTMPRVTGQDLGKLFEQHRAGDEGWSLTRFVATLLRVCETMAYAHSRGVLHRDLKPQNIMVGAFGEVYVVDWGLALASTAGGQLAASGSGGVHSDRRTALAVGGNTDLASSPDRQPGTLPYMAPEQAGGHAERMGPRADVYAIGALLYELVSGSRPYEEFDSTSLRTAVLAGPPRVLSELTPEGPDELVAIADRAMARDPEDRYPDMQSLAADLRAFLEGRVVLAHRTGPLIELRKWVQRNRMMAGTAAAAVLLVLAISGGAAALLASKNRELMTSNHSLELVSTTLRATNTDLDATARRLAATNEDLEEQTRRAIENAREAEAQRNGVLGLSAFRELERLDAEADDLWPALPESLPRLRAWMAAAEALVASLDGGEGNYPGHRAMLRQIEARGRLVEAQRDGDDPRLAELESLEAKLAALRYADDVYNGRREVVMVDLSAEELALSAIELSKLAWTFVDPARSTFGREAYGLALLRRCVEVDPGGATPRGMLSWALWANGLVEQALAEGRKAVEFSTSDEMRAAYQSYLDFMFQLLKDIDGITNSHPVTGAANQVAALEASLLLPPTWRFDEPVDAWWHENLARLIAAIDGFGHVDQGLMGVGVVPERGWGVGRRIATAEDFATRMEPGGDFGRRWQECRVALGAHPEYAAFAARLPSLPGLVPIGPDPKSGLWEFWHVLSGTEPTRDDQGRLRIGEESGIVLVLIPGGAFRMGSQSVAPDEPYYDVDHRTSEEPLHDVELGPFFMGKYEVTQGQWLRVTGTSPSAYGPGLRIRSTKYDLSHPLDRASWIASERFVRQIGLELPTEAQWEYAARARTTTPWSVPREELRASANFADEYFRRTEAPDTFQFEDWNDHYAAHAPVGAFAPNGFGLHDVHGNVAEWCRDWYGGYWHPTSPGTGERQTGGHDRVARGSNFVSLAKDGRSAARLHDAPDLVGIGLGLRASLSISLE